MEVVALLCITRDKFEDIYVKDDEGRLLAVIRCLRAEQNQVRLGILAPQSIRISRGPKKQKPTTETDEHLRQQLGERFE